MLLLLAFTGRQRPLSPEEKLLVGEWSDYPACPDRRVFTAEREFSSGYFRGVWQIDDGQLTLNYWCNWELPNFTSLSSIEFALDEYRRSRKTYVCQWDIEFSDDRQSHMLNHPVDEEHPDGKWHWDRINSR